MRRAFSVMERGVVRPWRRRTRNPFATDHTLLVHCSHHKVGTVWLSRVLTAVAESYGLRFHETQENGIDHRADILHYLHTRDFDRTRLARRPFRGSHLVRDPRDVAVSAYHYHLWTNEPWAREPHPAWNGQSYQEYLSGLDKDEGLLVEIEFSAGTVVRDMAEWDYQQPEFCELRYEKLLADEPGQFARLFRHYGFTDDAVDRCVSIAEQFTFRRTAGRTLGDTKERTHLRSGQPGEWREHFGSIHRERFEAVAGEALRKLGYETTSNW